MRYEKGHKDATRAHIVDVASAQFREGGLAAVGIAGIMSGAGLTNGAFYNHFESKEELVEAVLVNALGGRKVGLRANLEAGKALDATIRDYLSARHRDDAEAGGEPGRGAGRRDRAPPEDNARRLHRQDRGHCRSDRSPGPCKGSVRARRKRAIAVYGLMVGALQTRACRQ